MTYARSSLILLLVIFLAAHGGSSPSASVRCGCIEKDKLREPRAIASMVLGPPETEIQIAKCDFFCSTKSGRRFVKLDNGICSCYKEDLPPSFDCDEVLRESSNSSVVLPVYCVGTFPSSFRDSSTLAQEDTHPQDPKPSESVTSEEEEEESQLSRGIAPAAIVLGVLCFVVLLLFGIKTWFENSSKKRKSDIKSMESEKRGDHCAGDVGPRAASWNFNEDKIKETRFENNV